jgi:hypothetical protein
VRLKIPEIPESLLVLMRASLATQASWILRDIAAPSFQRSSNNQIEVFCQFQKRRSATIRTRLFKPVIRQNMVGCRRSDNHA